VIIIILIINFNFFFDNLKINEFFFVGAYLALSIAKENHIKFFDQFYFIKYNHS
jgi:hypothetical protein